MRKKLVMAVLLMAGFALTCGCSGGKSTITPPSYASGKPYRFVAYMTPPPANVGIDDLKDNPSYIEDRYYKDIADCGFNYACAVYESDLNDIRAVLDLCKKYNIKYLAKDQGGVASLESLIARGAHTDISAVTEAEEAAIRGRINTYKDHPALAGHVAFDEPSAKLYNNIKVVKDFYESYLPGKEFFVNLLPVGAADSQYGDVSYEEYVTQYIEKVQPSELSYDKYPLLKDPAGNPMLDPTYLKNLELFANHSKSLNVPFFVYLLTMGHWNYRTPSNYDDIAFQVYTSMAYGSRGAQTFTYWTTMSAGEQITHGLVDWYGNKTQTWYSMQEVISEVRSMQNAYMNFNWQNTVAYTADEDYPNVQYDTLSTTIPANASTKNPYAGVKSLSGSEDFILGCFTDAAERNGYMLANITDPGNDKTNEVTVTFNGAKEVLVYKKGRVERFRLAGGRYKTTLGSGEGQFLIPLK